MAVHIYRSSSKVKKRSEIDLRFEMTTTKLIQLHWITLDYRSTNPKSLSGSILSSGVYNTVRFIAKGFGVSDEKARML